MTLTPVVQWLIAETTRYLSPIAVATEWVIVIVAALFIVAVAKGKSRRLPALQQAFLRLALRKRTAIAICGVLPVVIRLSMLGFVPVPDASIHDEFSHLLLGDTLAHGRLTNPTHPMWVHFETIHVIQQPTYNSMYPPAQGAFLALGQVLFHEPWAGVLISAGLMFAATCWMMQGWLPPVWAFYGTLIAIAKFGIVGLWMNSYLSGAVPAIGGALLFGSLPRLRQGASTLPDSESEHSSVFRRVSTWHAGVRVPSLTFHAALLGLGLVILMNSRPFEGGVLAIASFLYLGPAILSKRMRLARLLVPAGIVLSLGVAFTGYYCYRVTGSPIRMPYQVNRDTYGWPENLAFLPAKNVVFRNKVMASMHKLELHNREAYTSLPNAIDSLNTRFFNNWTFFIGPVLTIPLMFLLRVFRDRRTRPLVLFISVVALLNTFQLVLYPYHLGPVVPILFAMVAQGIRHLYVTVSRLNRPAARYLLIVLPICLVLVSVMKQQAGEWAIPLTYWEVATETHRDARAAIEAWLSARPRKQLVLVRYSPNHSPNQEWVYNHADIDGSKIVWAREIDPASDAKLLQYFSDREAWVVAADVQPQRVVRYPGLPLPEEDAATQFTAGVQIP